MAVVRPGWRVLRSVLLSSLSLLPVLRRQLAWQLSGLAYRGNQVLAVARCLISIARCLSKRCPADRHHPGEPLLHLK